MGRLAPEAGQLPVQGRFFSSESLSIFHEGWISGVESIDKTF